MRCQTQHDLIIRLPVHEPGPVKRAAAWPPLIYGEDDMWCKVGEQEECSGTDGHVGIEGSSRQAGKSK